MSKSLYGKRSEKVNNNKADAVENVADLETYAAALGLSACDLAAFGLRDVITPKGAAVEIPYRRRDGTDVRKRIWRAPKGASAEWDEHEQAGTCLYGLDHIPSRGQTLFLVTGETGCHILWHYGLDAIGVSSAYDFVPSRDDPELEDYAIIALLEPDEDGDALVERLSLSRLRQDVRVVRLDGFANIAEAQTQHADIIVLVDRARRASEPLTVFLDDHPRLDKQKYPDRVEITLKELANGRGLPTKPSRSFRRAVHFMSEAANWSGFAKISSCRLRSIGLRIISAAISPSIAAAWARTASLCAM